MTCPYKNTDLTGTTNDTVSYSKYLHLPELLSLSYPINPNADDEPLFIAVHQTHELWFKQILKDLESVRDYIYESVEQSSSNRLLRVSELLSRCKMIVKLTKESLAVLETMTPMEFLDFRKFLSPASGFQSRQFRELEILLGLPLEGRKIGGVSWLEGKLDIDDRESVRERGQQYSISKALEKWLEHDSDRIAKLTLDQWTWESEYKRSIDLLAENDSTVDDIYNSLFDENEHQTLISNGYRKWSRKAILHCLFIYQYRNLGAFQVPYTVLQSALELEDALVEWRQRHASMAQRMIGSRKGTGSTSGSEYLHMAASLNKVFIDLRGLSLYMLSREDLPIIPPYLQKALG